MTFATPTSPIRLILGAIALGVILGLPALGSQDDRNAADGAAFNGVGGGAAALVSIRDFVEAHRGPARGGTRSSRVVFGSVVGTISFSGSFVAFAKLQELMTGRPITYPGSSS